MMAGSNHIVYFIGIGGIGMSALARWYNALGYQVAGYDKTQTPLTESLQSEGILIHYTDDITQIPLSFLNKEVLVIYTPAVPKNHKELEYFNTNGNTVIKRSDALAEALHGMFVVAVAGTHGKTTTTSMVAHMMRECGKNCFAFLGGISQNYNTNLLLGDHTLPEKIAVVEADEYDRSFLKLTPDIAVVTAIDPDHLDIYNNEEDFIVAFQQFLDGSTQSGFSILREDISKLVHSTNGATFGTHAGDYKAAVRPGTFTFDIVHISPEECTNNITLQLPGLHNILNALAAYIVGRRLSIPPENIKTALQNFKGVKRRFDYVVKTETFIYIDDYAHHPTEIYAILSSVKALYPAKHLTVIFQPHLYSRTRDFMDDFAASLSLADKLMLLDIYPARELPISGITSRALLEKTTCKEAVLVPKQEVLKYLRTEKLEVLVTIGAGDIDQLVQPIGNYIQSLITEKA